VSFFEYCNLKEFGMLMDCVRSVIEQPVMTINEEGIHCMGMDPSHVAMMEFKLPATAFTKFQPFGEDVLWDIDSMKRKLFKKAKITETLTFRNLITKKVLEWTRSEQHLNRVKRFPYIDPLKEEVPSPKIRWQGIVRIASTPLITALEDFDEHVFFSLDKDVFSLSELTDVSEDETPWDKDNNSILEMTQLTEEPVKSAYSAVFLLDIMRPLRKVAEVVKLSFTTSMPTLIEAELPQGTIKYWLAPCIGL